MTRPLSLLSQRRSALAACAEHQRTEIANAAAALERHIAAVRPWIAIAGIALLPWLMRRGRWRWLVRAVPLYPLLRSAWAVLFGTPSRSG